MFFVICCCAGWPAPVFDPACCTGCSPTPVLAALAGLPPWFGRCLKISPCCNVANAAVFGVLAALAAAVRSPRCPKWVLAAMAELHLQVGVLAVSAAVPAHLLPCLFAAVLADLHHDGCLNLWPCCCAKVCPCCSAMPGGCPCCAGCCCAG